MSDGIYDHQTRFDRHIDLTNMPSKLKDALIFVVGTLDTCKLGAEDVFGKDAKPEHTMFIFEEVVKHWHLLRSDENYRVLTMDNY